MKHHFEISIVLAWLAVYEIKKGTSVNLDVVSIHHDPSVFADPYKFDPNRFDVSLAKAGS